MTKKKNPRDESSPFALTDKEIRMLNASQKQASPAQLLFLLLIFIGAIYISNLYLPSMVESFRSPDSELEGCYTELYSVVHSCQRLADAILLGIELPSAQYHEVCEEQGINQTMSEFGKIPSSWMGLHDIKNKFMEQCWGIEPR